MTDYFLVYTQKCGFVSSEHNLKGKKLQRKKPATFSTVCDRNEGETNSGSSHGVVGMLTQR